MAIKYLRNLLAGTALTVASCASPLSQDDISLENRMDVEIRAEPYKKFTLPSLGIESLENGVKLRYDADKVNQVLDEEDKGTLDRIIQAYSYIKALDENNVKGHMILDYLIKATNDKKELDKILPGYSQVIANGGFTYLNKINEKLEDGNLEGNIRRLEHNIAKLPEGKDKEKLKEILDNFKEEGTNLRDFSRYTTMVGRMVGYCEESVMTNYESLEKALSGNDPYTRGEQIANERNIKLDFSGAKSPYDLICETHDERENAFKDYKEGRLNESDLEALTWKLTREEAKNQRVSMSQGGLEWDDAIPGWNIIKSITNRAGQFGGREGISIKNREHAENVYKLVVAHEYGIVPPVNMYANENRGNAAITAGITLGAVALSFGINEAVSGNGGSSSKAPMIRNAPTGGEGSGGSGGK